MPIKSSKKKKAIKKHSTKKKLPQNKTKKPSGSKGHMLDRVREKLLRQKNAILTEAGVAINNLPEPSLFSDLGDQASAECDKNFMLKLRGREQRLLKKIEDAIERIDSGTFGICEVCGNPIEIKRLEVRPVTTMCIDCKTEQEEEEKLRGL